MFSAYRFLYWEGVILCLFLKAFKKRHKMTPSQYRNLYAENKEDTPLS